MKTLYLDIFSGISGDMFIGALLDLGVDFHRLEHELAKLGIKTYHLHAARRQKSSIEGIKFDVHLTHDDDHDDHNHHHADEHDETYEEHHQHTSPAHAHPHEHTHEPSHSHEHPHEHHEPGDARDFAEIKRLILGSSLSDWVKQKAVAVFHRIAVAEGKIHGHAPDAVHFHEVGAVDSIMDIVGACIGLEMLGKPRIVASPVVDGHGWVDCAHGRFPIPTTASLEILGARGITVTQCDEPHELVTPTGAALLAEFAEAFGPMQGLAVTKIGYGLGTRDNKSRPNVLRAVLGETTVSSSTARDWETDTITILETNLDDTNPEILGYFMELAFAAGAFDVFSTAIQMKKNRSGVLLTLLCVSEDADKFAEMMLRETTALGIRRTTWERRKLRRESITVKTPYGEVAVKVGRLDGRTVQASPEFESCKAIAAREQIPLQEVYKAANAEIWRLGQLSKTHL